MENHHFQWVNPLFLWPCSIAFCMFRRPGKPWNHAGISRILLVTKWHLPQQLFFGEFQGCINLVPGTRCGAVTLGALEVIELSYLKMMGKPWEHHGKPLGTPNLVSVKYHVDPGLMDFVDIPHHQTSPCAAGKHPSLEHWSKKVPHQLWARNCFGFCFPFLVDLPFRPFSLLFAAFWSKKLLFHLYLQFFLVLKIFMLHGILRLGFMQGWFTFVLYRYIWVWVKIRYPNNWMVNTKLDISICGPTSVFHFEPHPYPRLDWEKELDPPSS